MRRRKKRLIKNGIFRFCLCNQSRIRFAIINLRSSSGVRAEQEVSEKGTVCSLVNMRCLFWGKCEYDGCSSKRTIIISFIFIWGAAAGVDSNNEAAVGTSNQLSKCKIVIIMLDSMASVNLLLSHSDCMRAWEIGREGERCSTEF